MALALSTAFCGLLAPPPPPPRPMNSRLFTACHTPTPSVGHVRGCLPRLVKAATPSNRTPVAGSNLTRKPKGNPRFWRSPQKKGTPKRSLGEDSVESWDSSPPKRRDMLPVLVGSEPLRPFPSEAHPCECHARIGKDCWRKVVDIVPSMGIFQTDCIFAA